MNPSQLTHESPTARQRTALLKRLADWFAAHPRPLPWRTERDPYRVWLREIMLQQTTVAAVIPYLKRFLDRFPTLHDLAAAEEADVLRLWEGLGYYSRARNLHRAARVLVDHQQGVFPSSVEELQSLPGIGRYTAGAIASFAFDQPAAIVEANTMRLYARLLGYDGDPRSTAGQRTLWTFAESLAQSPFAALSPGPRNQALMDLGAIVCTSTDPRCPECPVNRWCQAFAAGRQHEIPRAAKRAEITQVVEASIAVQDRTRYLLRRRQPGERWAGLWDFPRFTVESDQNLPAHLEQQVAELTGVQIALGLQIAEFDHAVTRFRIRLRCFAASKTGGRLRADREQRWVRPNEFAELPLSVTGRKLADRLRGSLFG